MNRSLKAAFGLSMLIALLVAAFGVMNATAKVSGHFVSGAEKTKFVATEATGSSHSTTLSAYGSTVTCHEVTYQVHHASTSTFTELTVTPTYKNCTSGESAATVRMNECHYQFRSRAASEGGHATVHLFCPEGKKAEVETSGGLEKFGAQTPTKGGVTYTNLEDGTVTVNVTAEGIHAECHGFCQLLGTNTTSATLTGSVTVEGRDTTTGNKVTVSAT